MLKYTKYNYAKNKYIIIVTTVNILVYVSEFLLSTNMVIYTWIFFLIKNNSKILLRTNYIQGYSREQSRIYIGLTMKNKNNS